MFQQTHVYLEHVSSVRLNVYMDMSSYYNFLLESSRLKWGLVNHIDDEPNDVKL
jgi:hypothetical protein